MALGTAQRRGTVSWLLFWVVAHALLGAALLAASGWVINTFEERTTVIMPALSGIVIGLGEWYLLRPRLARADRWFLATLAAALAGTALVWRAGLHLLFADNPFWPEWYEVTGSIVMGVVLSLAQAAVLRREDERYSRRMVEWLVIGSVAYGLGQWSIVALTWGQASTPPFLGLGTQVVASRGWLLRQGCIGVLGWTVYGVVTALALTRWPGHDSIG